MVCQGCSTPHHQECYDENGGCTLFGCKFAPPDEPKIQVTNSEASVFGAPAVPSFAQVSTAPQRPATGFGDVSPAWQLNPPVAPVPFRTSTVPPPPRIFQAPTPWPSPTIPTGATPIAGPAPVPVASSNGGAGRSGYVTPGGIFDGVTVEQARSKERSRLVYILLGIFLGAVGAHSFYAGFYKRGALQLCLSVLTFGYGAIITWIWALAEVCTVDRDANRREFY